MKGKEFAEKLECDRVVTDLLQLANDPTVDAVYVASPNAFHYTQSKLMLEHGKHVICEKPITVTPDELEELQSLAKRKNLVYMEALMALHMSEWETVKNTIKRLGNISHARFDFSQRSSKLDGLLRGEHQNIFDPKMAAGTLMDLGIYCIYPCIDWFGLPESVYSYCVKISTGVDGSGGAVLRYPDKTVELTWSKLGESRLGSEIIGTEGTLVIPSISKLCNMKFIAKDGTEEILSTDDEKPKLMSFEGADFYRYITDEAAKEELQYNNRLALEVSKIMLEIRKQSGIEFDL
jgi:predicted dehydrogenase